MVRHASFSKNKIAEQHLIESIFIFRLDLSRSHSSAKMKSNNRMSARIAYSEIFIFVLTSVVTCSISYRIYSVEVFSRLFCFFKTVFWPTKRVLVRSLQFAATRTLFALDKTTILLKRLPITVDLLILVNDLKPRSRDRASYPAIAHPLVWIFWFLLKEKIHDFFRCGLRRYRDWVDRW